MRILLGFLLLLLALPIQAQQLDDLILRRSLEERHRAERHMPTKKITQEEAISLRQKLEDSKRLSHARPMADDEWENDFGFGTTISGGTVNCIYSHGDSVFIGGDFREFDGTLAWHLALYNRKTKRFSEFAEARRRPSMQSRCIMANSS